MSDVTSRGTLSLEFTGLDGGDGELTWGQRFVWNILQPLAPDNHFINIRFRVHLPTQVTRERLLSALHAIVRRHESLRTRFPVGADGEPRQQCDPAGELPVEICETDPGNVHRVAEQEEQRLWQVPFRNEIEWPLRLSVIVADGRPRQVVFVFSHLAVDAWGWLVLRKEFLELLRHDGAEPALAGWQPRARAAFEMSPPGRTANDRSLAHWRRVLETAQQTAFPALPEAGETPLFPGVGVHSAALAAAARTLAARQRAGPAAVILATLATIIGIRTGTEVVPLALAAGNRITPVDTASVGTFYQVAPALIPLDSGSLAGTIRTAHKASTVAYLRGQSDPRDVARLLDTVNSQRGVAIDLSSTMNMVPEPATAGAPATVQGVAHLRELTASTAVSDLPGRDSERLKLYLHVLSLHPRAIVQLFCDSRYLAAADARKLLAGLELVLIEMLEAGDLSQDQVADLIGIAPLALPPECAVVDNCRIDVAAVRGLLLELPTTVASQVFVVGSDDGSPQLVAYVVAAEPTTPQRLHAALVSKLDGHLTMAPQQYVICDGAPTHTDSRADWERQVVLRQGSGQTAEQPTDPDPTPPVDAHLGA